MEKTKLEFLNAELDKLQEMKNVIRKSEKEIAMKVLKEHFGGDYTFLTEECKNDGDFDACPSILSCTMVKDSDPADAFITRIRVGSKKDLLSGEERETVYLDLYAYYLGTETENMDAEYESPLDWGEIANCLLVAALNN